MLKKKEIARKAVRLLVRKLPKDREVLISTGELLSFLADLYRRSRDARNFFVSPFVPREQKIGFLKGLIDRFGVPHEALEIFEYMVDINAFSLLTEMKRLYDHEVEKLMKMSKGFLYLAREVDSEEVNRIVEAVQKALGREIEVEVSYDERLIGGFVFKTSGFVVDTSVRRQLEKLLIHGG